MCFFNFATGYFLTLKTQAVSHVMELMFIVQISAIYPTTNTEKSVFFYAQATFASLTGPPMVIPISNHLSFFFRTDAIFLSDDLVKYSTQRSKRIDDEKNQMQSELKL